MPQTTNINEVPKTSVLADGTIIKRAYTDDLLETKRVSAINVLGTSWLMHPKNKVQRGGVLPLGNERDDSNFFLTRYFDNLKLQAA